MFRYGTHTLVLLFLLLLCDGAPTSRVMTLEQLADDTSPARRLFTIHDFLGDYTRFMELSRSGQLCPKTIHFRANGVELPSGEIEILLDTVSLNDNVCSGGFKIQLHFENEISEESLVDIFRMPETSSGVEGILRKILTEIRGFYYGIEEALVTCGEVGLLANAVLLFTSDSEPVITELRLTSNGHPKIILYRDSEKTCLYSGQWSEHSTSPSPSISQASSQEVTPSPTKHAIDTTMFPQSSISPEETFDFQTFASTPTPDASEIEGQSPSPTITVKVVTPSPSLSISPSASVIGPTRTPVTTPKPSSSGFASSSPTTTGGEITVSPSPTSSVATGVQTATVSPTSSAVTSIETATASPTLSPTVAFSQSGLPSEVPPSPSATQSAPSFTSSSSPTSEGTPSSSTSVTPSKSSGPSAEASVSPSKSPESSIEMSSSALPQSSFSLTPSPVGPKQSANSPVEESVEPSFSSNPTNTDGVEPSLTSISPSQSVSVTAPASSAPSVFPVPSPVFPSVMPTMEGVAYTPEPELTIQASPPSMESATSSQSAQHSPSVLITATGSITPTASSSALALGTSPNADEPSPEESEPEPDPEPTEEIGLGTPESTVEASPLASGSPSSSGTPSPSPVPDNDGAACFPANAKVKLLDDKQARMDTIKLGDLVSVGGGIASHVIAFTHSDGNIYGPFLRFATDSGRSLCVSSGHYVYSSRGLVQGAFVRKGDFLQLENGTMTKVDVKETVYRRGLFNPQTTHGDIVVDGFRVSTYTSAIEPAAAHALLAPIRVVRNIALGSHLVELIAGNVLLVGTGRALLGSG